MRISCPTFQFNFYIFRGLKDLRSLLQSLKQSCGMSAQVCKIEKQPSFKDIQFYMACCSTKKALNRFLHIFMRVTKMQISHKQKQQKTGQKRYLQCLFDDYVICHSHFFLNETKIIQFKTMLIFQQFSISLTISLHFYSFVKIVFIIYLMNLFL